MKLFKNPKLAIPIMLALLLVGAVVAYFAVGANFIQCSTGNVACLEANGATGDPTDNDDLIIGSVDDDTIDAKAGNDVVFGEAGNDVINGEAGNDTISGDAGTDTLCGNAGNDILYGGAGNDSLEPDATCTDPGKGSDVYYGGPGEDTYGVDTSGEDSEDYDTYIFMAGDVPADTEYLYTDSGGTTQICNGDDVALFIGYFGTEMQTMSYDELGSPTELTDGHVYWVVKDPITGGPVVIGDAITTGTDTGYYKNDCILKGVYDKRPAS